jgi:hypothetical protein
LFRARIVLENNFDILKKTFKELLIKSNLHVLFFPNVVVCHCMLHNMILNGKDIDIDKLMFHLEQKDMLEINKRCEEERL